MGSNTLLATVGSLAPIVFTATGVAGAAATDLTFQHGDGYRWNSASVYPSSNWDWQKTVTFHWESTGYAAGGHGTIYGVHFVDVYEPGVYAAQVALISETNLDSVQQAACAGLAYSEYYSRIADGQILCLKRVSTGEFAAVKLLSHVSEPGGTYAQSALLRVKTFGSAP
ncbi:MAG: hypothetical protein ACR2L6_00110 [Gemmatimonadaceae bacterium]